MVATNVAERTTISQEWTIAEPLAPTRALDLLSATAADQLRKLSAGHHEFTTPAHGVAWRGIHTVREERIRIRMAQQRT